MKATGFAQAEENIFNPPYSHEEYFVNYNKQAQTFFNNFYHLFDSLSSRERGLWRPIKTFEN